MPYLLKHTILFNGPRHGASESLYFQQSTLDLRGAVAALEASVIPKRAKLLGAEWQITAHRVTLVQDNAGLPVKRVSRISKGFWPGVQAQVSAETGVSLQALMEDSSNQFKKLTFMCGPYRSIFPSADSLDPNQGNFLTNFNSWSGAIISNVGGMGWLHRSATQTAVITGYTEDATTGVVDMTLLAPGITWAALGKPVSVAIEFPLQRSPLDGQKIVIPSSATALTMARPVGVRPFNGVNGTLRLFSYTFVNLATTNNLGQTGSVDPQNPVERKRGRPTLASRGRAAVRVQW